MGEVRSAVPGAWVTETVRPRDSATTVAPVVKGATSPVAHKRHPRAPVTRPADGAEVGPGQDAGNRGTALAVSTPVTAPKVALQWAFQDNTEFKLLSAEGSTRGQTVKMTVVLTTKSANWGMWTAVKSIIDGDGNEYQLKSFMNGASAYDSRVQLITDVPIKCSYTFGGILPSVKVIKLFQFRYSHRSLDDPISVEFRDIPVTWR